MIIDQELNKQVKERKVAEQEIAKLKSQNKELITLAKAAAQSEEKKDALLQELKVAVAEERDRLEKERAAVSKDKGQLDEYKRIKEEEYLALKKQFEEKVFDCKELTMKLEVAQSSKTKLETDKQDLGAKEKSLLARIESLEKELEAVRADSAHYEEQLKRECEDARVEVDDLSDIVKTKDKMLED